MKIIDGFVAFMALVVSTGSLVMWGIGIATHAPYDEKSYWLLLMFVMGWIFRNKLEYLEKP